MCKCPAYTHLFERAPYVFVWHEILSPNEMMENHVSILITRDYGQLHTYKMSMGNLLEHTKAITYTPQYFFIIFDSTPLHLPRSAHFVSLVNYEFLLIEIFCLGFCVDVGEMR